jgi:hypothetical protein
LPWFGVRGLIRWSISNTSNTGDLPLQKYEESIRIISANTSDEAIDIFRRLTLDSMVEGDVDLGFYQTFLVEGNLRHGIEVFSLLRYSSLDEESYIARHFKTGTERERDS